jgi:hypothetical protein
VAQRRPHDTVRCRSPISDGAQELFCLGIVDIHTRLAIEDLHHAGSIEQTFAIAAPCQIVRMPTLKRLDFVESPATTPKGRR